MFCFHLSCSVTDRHREHVWQDFALDQSGRLVVASKQNRKGMVIVRDHPMPIPLCDRSNPPLDWKSRLRIAVQIAQELEFLHNDCVPCIIHGDIRTDTILLKQSGEANLTDFGRSKSFEESSLQISKFFVKESSGYLDPAYYDCQKLTRKSDVYSFGILLLELVSGRGPLNTDLIQAKWKIAVWMRSHLIQGDLDTVVDKGLNGGFNDTSMWTVVDLAMTCAEPRSIDRPTISQVVLELESALKEGENITQFTMRQTTMGPQTELLELLSKSRFRNLVSGGVSDIPKQARSKKRRVVPRTKSVIAPATRTGHPPWLPLTSLDRVVNPTFVGVIFVYENIVNDKGSVKTFEEVTTSLKDSLAKVLVDFYPLAGRLTLKECGSVDLQCNDAGAIFVEASLDVELSQLEGPGGENGPMPMLSGMDVMDNVARAGPGLHYIPDMINREIPVLVIQVTRFLCGSVAVAVNWHHTVADGWSGCHFVRSWVAMATRQALPLRPSFDRRLLQPRSPTDGSRITNGNYGSSQTCDQTSEIPDRTVEMPVRQHSTAPLAASVIKPFKLPKDAIQRLKNGLNDQIKIGNSSIGDPKPFTSTEAISAELWKLITKARIIHDEEARARSRFFMFVDGRKKLGLPSGYFGNVVCSACAETTQDELLKKPLSYAASLIQTATRGIDKDYFLSLIDWVEERGIVECTAAESEHLKSTGNDVAATFWTSFPLYDINFGWGKPVLSFRNAPPRKLIDGIAMMPDPTGSGNMIALLNLHKDRMERLEQDPEFRETAQFLHSKSR